MGSKWKNNTDSPVLFFINDFTNKWVDLNNDGKILLEQVWGYAGFDKNVAFHFFEKEILSINSKIKTTFFVLVGKLINLVNKSKIKSFSDTVNVINKSKKFFKTLNNDDHFEITCHGTTYEVLEKAAKDFIQERKSIKSLDEILATIKRGKEYKKMLLEFSQMVVQSILVIFPMNFQMKSLINRVLNASANIITELLQMDGVKPNFMVEIKSLSSFNLKFFGKNKLVDIPITISRDLLNTVLRLSKSIKRILKKILKSLII